MKLNFMSANEIVTIKANFASYMPYYINNDKEGMLRRLHNENALQPSHIECDDFLPQLDMKSSNYDASDLQNIQVIYEALKDVITPSIACDERFWAGLAHDYLWEYVQYRRKNELTTNNPAAVELSYFFTYGGKRSAHIHCISRLWWAGFLTYDNANTKNHFELTKVIFSWAFPSNILLMSSSNMTTNKNLLLGVLRSLKKRQEHGEKPERYRMVEALKYLNGMGAVTLVDMLSSDEVEQLVDSHLNSLFGNLDEQPSLFR